jgi:GntR family transcriptional regulator
MAERPKQTLVARLRDDIAQFVLDNCAVGDRLPSEAELTKQFSVSRPALREALKLLEEDGLITVVHGLGRFASALVGMPAQRPITRFESVTHMVQAFGYEPVIRVLSLREVAASAATAQALHVPVATPVICLERLRVQDDIALVYGVDIVPRSAIAADTDAVDWTGSLVEILDRFGHRPVMSAASVSAVTLPPEIAAYPGLLDFGPALLIEEVAYETGGQPIIHARDYHRGSAMQFSFIRK